METTWTEDQFKAYLYIYAAHADFTESYEELSFIQNHVSAAAYTTMHTEFEKDNDYQSIQKIQAAANRLGYTSENREKLIDEVHTIFAADGDVDAVEKATLSGLKRLLGL